MLKTIEQSNIFSTKNPIMIMLILYFSTDLSTNYDSCLQNIRSILSTGLYLEKKDYIISLEKNNSHETLYIM